MLNIIQWGKFVLIIKCFKLESVSYNMKNKSQVENPMVTFTNDTTHHCPTGMDMDAKNMKCADKPTKK